MKLLIFFVFTLISCLLSSCVSNSDSSTSLSATTLHQTSKSGYSKFEFNKELYKFGSVSQGEVLVCDFYFTNIGSQALIIKSIETSCGCTAVVWDKKPVLPNQQGKIRVEFDTKGRSGKQYKAISIFSNTLDEYHELVVTAEVE